MMRGFFQPVPRGNGLVNRLLVTVALMVTFGSLMVASSAEGQAAIGGSAFAIASQQVVWVVLGTVGCLVLMVAPLPRLMSLAKGVSVLALGLLAYVAVAGVKVDGGRRWIAVGSLNLQPSELFKLVTVIAVAAMIAKKRATIGDGQRLLVAMGPTLLGLGLIAAGSDFGTTSIVASIAFAMLIAAGMSWRQQVLSLGVAVTLFVGALQMHHFRYALHRLTSFLHPSQDLAGLGYQLQQSKVGLGAGYLWGLGYGQSREKWGLLPNPHTDFIFSIIGEELGLLGTLTVVALFVYFLSLATKIIQRCPNDTYRLMAVGITTWIVLEAIINIASVVGFWAVTGVPLPFFSYGGTSLVMELSAVGLLCNIANQHDPAPPIVLQAKLPPYLGRQPRHSSATTLASRARPRPGS